MKAREPGQPWTDNQLHELVLDLRSESHPEIHRKFYDLLRPWFDTYNNTCGQVLQWKSFAETQQAIVKQLEKEKERCQDWGYTLKLEKDKEQLLKSLETAASDIETANAEISTVSKIRTIIGRFRP